MKRLLTSTTALSLAFAPLSPLPLAAQVAVDTPEGPAFCLAAEADPCPEGEVCFVAETGDCTAAGIEAEAANALTEAAGGAPATPGADAPDTAADPSGTAAPDAPQDDAVDEAGAEVEPAATAGEAAPETSPVPSVEAEAAATPEAASEAPVEPPAVEPPAEEAASEEATAEEMNVEAAPVPPQAEGGATPVDAGPTDEVAVEEPAPLQDPAAHPPETVESATTGAASETAAPGTDSPDATTAQAQEAPAEIIGEAAAVLQDILGVGSDAAEGEAPAAAAAAAPGAGQTEGTDPAAAADVTETEITEDNSRASSEEFAPTASAPTATEGRKGLSDLERFGLVALGALAVGAILKNGDQVVSNTGDRVVVEDDRGEFRVLKDDDTLLRRPGSRLRTETFNDGSTRSTLAREDGSSIVTIRDASGRVLRRARYALDGTELVLIDDLQQFDRIDVATLPPPPAPRDQTVISAAQSPDDLALALAAIEARDNARAYSLRQIREYREVRALAPTIDVESITFRSGSSAIDVTEAEKLSALGRLIAGVLETRPYEIFLVEGHTDAVGSAASNLALSDRRAESVALALTEYFGIPPENLVVQGYGEAELRIPTQAAEERNRRAAVRLISPLLRTAARR